MDIDGLAGFTAAGLTGLGAGMSHSPTEDGSGKERYVFFARPPLAVDSAGKAGDCIRAGRAGCSHACGALIKLQPKFQELKSGGKQIRAPGTCDHMNPEYSLLEARMLSAVTPDQIPPNGLDLVQVTKLADGVIRTHMEELVRASVDPSKADFAIVTGVQIHSYGHTLDEWHPNMEYICPTSMTIVTNGKRTDVDLLAETPAPTPRQLFALRAGAGNGEILAIHLHARRRLLSAPHASWRRRDVMTDRVDRARTASAGRREEDEASRKVGGYSASRRRASRG